MNLFVFLFYDIKHFSVNKQFFLCNSPLTTEGMYVNLIRIVDNKNAPRVIIVIIIV